MYPFTPLNESQIRIMNILPAIDAEAEIRCELHHRKFEPGTYNALSYTWGNPDPRKSIYIDDKHVEVTPNLFAALQTIRHTSDKVCLWVDALCINQNDAQEKTSQVKRMTEIYANAMTVFMWLGEEGDDSDLAIALLQRLEKQLTGIFSPENNKNLNTSSTVMTEDLAENDKDKDDTYVAPLYFEAFSSTLIQSQPANNTPEDEKFTSDTLLEIFRSESFNRHWRALRRLFYRPYWFRVWIIQEIVLPHWAILCCGSQKASWNAFMIFVDHFKIFKECNPSVEALATMTETEWSLKQYARLYKDIVYQKKPSFLEGLVQLRRYSASDSRDHVNAILNLVEHKGFQPDYTKSVDETYKDVVKFIIEQDQTLDVLSACKPSRSMGSLLQLQSKMDFKDSLDQIASINNLSSSDYHSLDSESANPFDLQSIITNLQEALQQITGSLSSLDAICSEAAAPEKNDRDKTADMKVLISAKSIAMPDRSAGQDTVTHCIQSVTRLINSTHEVKILHEALLPADSQEHSDENRKKRAKMLTKSLENIGLDYEGFLELLTDTTSKFDAFKDLWSRLESLRPDLLHQRILDPDRARMLEIYTHAQDLHRFARNIIRNPSKPEKNSLTSVTDKMEGNFILDESAPAPAPATASISASLDTSSRCIGIEERGNYLSTTSQTESDISPKPFDFENKVYRIRSAGKSFIDAASDLVLPSWVPDWRTATLEFENLLLRNPRNCHYKAGGSTPSFHFPNDQSIMIVDGLRLGSVQTMSLDEYEEPEIRIKDEWNTWLTASHPRHMYGSQKDQQKAFIRTLVAGRNVDGSKGTCGLTVHLLDETFDLGFVEANHDECNTNWTMKTYQKISIERSFKFGITDQGFMARIPNLTEKGDIIAILLGARAPFVLRRYEKLDVYLVVGECYVDGVMEGEVVEELTTGARSLDDLEEFRLV